MGDNGDNLHNGNGSLQRKYFERLSRSRQHAVNNNSTNNNRQSNTSDINYLENSTNENDIQNIDLNNNRSRYTYNADDFFNINSIPLQSHSPERTNRYSRSNSTSPIRRIPDLNQAVSVSSYQSPTRAPLLDNHTDSILEDDVPYLHDSVSEYTDFRPDSNRLSKKALQLNPFYDYDKINYDNPFNDNTSDIELRNNRPNDVFAGYEFDNDEMNEDSDEFTPFPVLENSYYPVNLPYDVYNPFSENSGEDSSEDSRDSIYDSEENETECDIVSTNDLERNNTTFRNAKAVQETVNYYGDKSNDAPKQLERDPSARQVRMVDGNLVLDCPVSKTLLQKYKVPITDKEREFKFMRFQACTSQPEDFQFNKFSLRQSFYTHPRETELLIVITMYNENEILLARTLKGVFKNLKYLYNMKYSSTWGKSSWQKVVVCIVSDGRKKINPRSKALLAAMGVYQEGFAKNRINDNDVVSHIYEYTTMVGISKIDQTHVTLTVDNTIPVQMIFCLKEQNQRKINSHKWAFKAFSPILDPNVIILLDVGTEPDNKSLYKLWKSFKDNPNVAGSCGEIKVSLGKQWRLLANPLVAAQNFEYKTSNILDKPMESVFGFVTVLPGAFSAYRYQALIGEPIEKYLKGEDLKKTNNDGIFNANMYLAEDRILCFELIAKRNANWILKYVHTAGAYTDVPEKIDDFISQRRRWLNGSFFAAVYSVCNFFKIWSTNHSFGRKFMLQIQFFYQLLNLLVSWFSLGSYFLVFRILSCYLAEPAMHFAPGNVLSVFFLWLYMASITTTFVLSFGNKPKGTKKFYLIIVIFFACLMIYMIFAAIFLSVKSIQTILKEHKHDFNWKFIFVETQFRNLLIAIISTYLLYFLGFLMFFQPVHMLTSFTQYLLLSPAYVNILNIYAFCNIHDISWGTKGQDKIDDLGIARTGISGKDDELEIVIPTTEYQIDTAYSKMVRTLTTPQKSEDDKTDPEEEDKFYYAFFRSMTVLLWMFSNFVLVAVVTQTGGLSQFSKNEKDDDDSILPSKQTFIFLSVILYIVAFMALFRFVGSTVYLVQRGLNKFGIRS